MNTNTEREELARTVAIALCDVAGIYETSEQEDREVADAILAAGYSKPRTITTVEELDALPVGSVVLSESYTHHESGMRIAFQKWDSGFWHRGGRSGHTHPDYFLPATVLYTPEATR